MAKKRAGGLHDAIKAKDHARLSALLEAGADPNAHGPGELPPLWLAATFGEVRCVRTLVQAGAALQDGMLAAAVDSGKKEVVRALLEAGADPAGGAWEPPPLLSAVRRRKLDVIALLLEAGAPVDLVSRGETALSTAARIGAADVVRELLAAGADPTLETCDGTPAEVAARAGKQAVVRLLLAAGASAAEAQAGKRRAAAEAAFRAIREADQAARARSADPRRADSLVDAAGERDVRLVRDLLARGAKLDAKGRGGYTALMMAIGADGAEEVVDAVEEVVDTLLEAGADPRATGEGGLTALHLAAAGGLLDVVDRLLRAGADPGAKDDGGKTPAEYVPRRRRGAREVLERLAAAASEGEHPRRRKGRR